MSTTNRQKTEQSGHRDKSNTYFTVIYDCGIYYDYFLFHFGKAQELIRNFSQ